MPGLKRHEFKVEGDVKPIPYKDRTPIEVNTFETFYVSYRGKIVCPCKVESLHTDWKGRPMAWIVITDSSGESKHNMYTDEIGSTPEEAVKHQWNFYTT